MRFRTVDASNGSYTGETNWRKQPHGFGTVRFNNGDEVSGTWVNGVLNGHATYRMSNGDEVSGNCVRGLFNDRHARYYAADGREWEIVIVNGEVIS